MFSQNTSLLAVSPVLLDGQQAAFLSFDDYNHHLGLNTWESRGGTPSPKGQYWDMPRYEWKFYEDGMPELINQPADVDRPVEEGRL